MQETSEKYSSFWTISNKFRKDTEPFFRNLDQVFACRGEYISSDPVSRMIRVKYHGQGYFIKTYTKGGKRLRRFIGRNRARAEWENLRFFSRLGIPTPELVAWGQDIHFGLFQRGAVITKEIKDSTDLATLAREGDECIYDNAWMDHVGFLYSKYARLLHDNGFVHTDFKWRNILVTKGEKPEVYLIDCPSGRKMVNPFFIHWRIKDLACLDKIARYHLSPATRLKFYKHYTGRARLSPKDKRVIKKIIRFYKLIPERKIVNTDKSWQYRPHEKSKGHI